MACGYEALKSAGIHVTEYYASEIDKHAIQIAKKNHPKIKHLGDVTRWREWKIPRPNLVIGGSPCQGFSLAGDGRAFEDPRSKLFFEMTDIIRYFKPDFHLLENVKMKQIFLDIITDFMQCGEPHLINSALVSAQNRQRYYWYNWEAPDPADRDIVLKDILEKFVDESFNLSSESLDYMNRTVIGGRNHWDFKHHHDSDNNKSSALVANLYKGVPYNVLIDRRSPNRIGTALDINGHDYCKRVYHPHGKSPCLTASSGGNLEPKIALSNIRYRKLTPVECERLQTLPDNYTGG